MDVHGRELRYFVTVAEELHFTRAAERLFVSQPALSKQIRMLERQLGAELFVRDRQGVALTPVGAALLPHARRVLAAWDEAWAAAEQAKGEQRATVLVGMSTSPGRGGMLPAIRSRFTAVQPRGSGAAARGRLGGPDRRAGQQGGRRRLRVAAAARARTVPLDRRRRGAPAGRHAGRRPARAPARRDRGPAGRR